MFMLQKGSIILQVRAWLQPGGYLICFGTIMLKMWRVYYIFHHPSAKKKRKVRIFVHSTYVHVIITNIICRLCFPCATNCTENIVNYMIEVFIGLCNSSPNGRF